MTQCATYRQAQPGDVTVGTLVYIRVGEDFRKARVKAIVPDYGILLRVSESTVPVWGISYSLPELFVKVD
jgi:hypothetical protein